MFHIICEPMRFGFPSFSSEAVSAPALRRAKKTYLKETFRTRPEILDLDITCVYGTITTVEQYQRNEKAGQFVVYRAKIGVNRR